MVDLNLDNTSSESLWSTIISVALLLLAIKFPILFLLNGLISTGFGLYFIIISYTKLSNENISEGELTLNNYINFMGWINTILGVACMIIFFVMKINRSIL